ncbi:MAG: DUF933 domain-containing protein [Elusimicrobiota bacterium]
MKIGYSGLDLTEGKIKYKDTRLEVLSKNYNPKKTTPFYAEFIKNEYVQADTIVLERSCLLDLLIIDIGKCETRLSNTSDSSEIELMNKSIKYLEEELPLCDAVLTDDERDRLRALSIISVKPVVILDDIPDVNDIIKSALDKAQVVFFYTVGKDEVRAWPVEKSSDIVSCAGKIHTDLARGFIRADVVPFEDMVTCHSMNDAKKRGLAKVVNRDYIIKDSDIIEIRYNI